MTNHPAIEPKAVEVLKAACAVLADAKAMSFTAVNSYEKAARNGRPLFYTTPNQVTMQRPDKLRKLPQNTLNPWLDVQHAFQTWAAQMASRLQELGVCKGAA